MDKLIINHGERVTEHEIGDAPLVIGRDPECDLFFADKKLSRRHARFERSAGGVRLVDLGSRNGSWVNEERIDERELTPGDEVRLGGLHIQFESRRAAAVPGHGEMGEDRAGAAGGDEGDESTVYLGGDTALPDTGTVVFRESLAESPEGPGSDESGSQTVVLSGGGGPSPPPTPDDSSTVVLSADAVHELQPEELDETLQKPEPARTVVLSGQASKSPYDTGAVVYKGEVAPEIREAATRLFQEGPAQETSDDPFLELEEEPESHFSASVTYVPDVPSPGRGWAAKFTWLAIGLALFACLVLTVPLIRILGAATADQSASRARALLGLLAAVNETALGEGRPEQASTERVTGETGVTEALVLDPQGRILAPRSRAGEPLTLEGLGTAVGDVRNLRHGVGENGEMLLAQPVSHRGRRVGVVVLQLAPPDTGRALMALLFGVGLLAVAVAVTVLLARRMTVGPVNELRLEVEALGDARPGALSVDRPYHELSLLASSLNRLLAARPVGDPSREP